MVSGSPLPFGALTNLLTLLLRMIPFAVQLIPAGILLLGSIWLHESPRWVNMSPWNIRELHANISVADV